jgi:gliding motility-associated-like protein
MAVRLGLQLYRLLVLVLLVFDTIPSKAQLPVWNDLFQGGLVTGSFSLGTETFGTGSFEMPIPAGATIRKAFFFSTQVGSNTSTVEAELNGVPYLFGPGNIGPSYNSVYGRVYLHTIEVTDDLDPADTNYTVRISIAQAFTHSFTEFYVIVAYELPGAAPIWADVFFSNADSQQLIDYTIETSAPMLTAGGIAFATMAGYSNDTMQDCEHVTVNDVYLGSYQGGDFNAVSTFGTSGSFHFAQGIFVGLGDDNEDQAIDGQDVLSDISGLVQNGATSFRLQYEHCPSQSPDDNLVNLIVLAYASDPCLLAFDLGPDTSFCAGGTIILDATRPDASYLWSDGSMLPTLAVTTSGTYRVVLSAGACIWTDSIYVEVRPLPAIELGPDRSVCEGESVTLVPGGQAGSIYSWSDGGTADSLVVLMEGTYSVAAELVGCTAVDSVRVSFEDCSFDLRMPNIFSPNGDGDNELFSAIAAEGIASFRIDILNRWGQVVYTSASPSFAWDGRTGSGEPVSDGVYFWVIEYTASQNSDQRSLTGTVTILR